MLYLENIVHEWYKDYTSEESNHVKKIYVLLFLTALYSSVFIYVLWAYIHLHWPTSLLEGWYYYDCKKHRVTTPSCENDGIISGKRSAHVL